MKITKQQLKKLIKEEIKSLHEAKPGERMLDPKYYAKGMHHLRKLARETEKKRRAAAAEDKAQRAMCYPIKEDQERALELAKQDDRNKQESLQEDGHQDVPSACRAMKTIIEDAGQMLQVLEQMDGHLPTWWTNKMAVAANNLNKMRDYLLVNGE